MKKDETSAVMAALVILHNDEPDSKVRVEGILANLLASNGVPDWLVLSMLGKDDVIPGIKNDML